MNSHPFGENPTWYIPQEPTVRQGSRIDILIGVKSNTSNNVHLRYRINGGPEKTVKAGILRVDSVDTRYYIAEFPEEVTGLDVGDTIEYGVVCEGRQVPSAEDVEKMISSFIIIQNHNSYKIRPNRDNASETKNKDERSTDENIRHTTYTKESSSSILSNSEKTEDKYFDEPIISNYRYNPKIIEYAKLSRLDDITTKRLTNKNPNIQDESALDALVKEGVLTKKQKKDLQIIVTLGKLTGNNSSFIEAITSENLGSIVDLINKGKEDWQRMIIEKKILLPNGETTESYADNILFSLDKTFPSQFLLKHLSTMDIGNPILNKLDQIDSLNSLMQILKLDKLIDHETGTPSSSIDWSVINADNREKLRENFQELTEFANTYKHLGVIDIINDKNLDSAQKKDSIYSRIGLINTFYKNNPNLDLRLISFFDKTEKQKINWNDIPVADQYCVRKQMMAYQRMMNIAEETSDMMKLLGKGYDSFFTISGTTEDRFVNTSGIDSRKARMTYANAQQYSLLVAHTSEAIRDTVRGQFKDIAMANVNSNAIINDLMEIDGFENLFGPQNFCGCEDCRSILSPAAYFVDLMHFIEKNISDQVFSARQDHPLYLRNRRKDLWELKFNCVNTNTFIPYLTIVNEILESYLQSSEGYTNVFNELSQTSANISFALPFNLALEELRLYLGHFETSLHKIYSLLYYQITEQNNANEKVWRAKIDISKEEFEIITSPDPAHVILRFDNHPQSDDFDVQEFINIIGVTRAQLDDLLSIKFSPDLKNMKVQNKQDRDELQNYAEIINHESINNDRLDFIHRFVRLWKKTPFSINELDLLLTSLNSAGIISQKLDNNAVICIAQLIDIQERLTLDNINDLCAMFYFMQVPKNFPDLPTVLYPINDSRVDHFMPILLGTLGISETELMLLLELVKNEIRLNAEGHHIINLKTLSLLNRYVRLARILKLSIEDFIKLLFLAFENSTQVALDIKDLKQILEILEIADWIDLSPFDIPKLSLILKGQESDIAKYKTTTENTAEIVKEIQAQSELSSDSQTNHKLELLEAYLLKSFNLTSNYLNGIMKWISVDINDNGIKTALNTTFNPSTGKPDHPEDLDILVKLLKEMECMMILFDSLKFSEETITYVTKNYKQLFEIADIQHLSLDDLKALVLYKDIIKEVENEEAESLMRIIMEGYVKSNNNKFPASAVNAFARLWKQDQKLIDSLVNSLSFSITYPLNIRMAPLSAVDYLRRCVRMCTLLGINGHSLVRLEDDTNFDEVTLAKEIVLGAFNSRYDNDKTRKEKLEPYQDKINVKKRDILCNYIIALKKNLKFKNNNDIYNFFLLDLEMSGCFRISRLVCAISSLQLYVHRCLINLEQSTTDPDIRVDPAMIPSEELEWRKNYRVWQANREVFLYPENYIEPDLRDNKSPLFKELEDELLQQKITKESAETAYKKYLSQFVELTNLKIVGAYYNSDSNTYYFFACSQQDPPQYYYRKWIGYKLWMPWERIELSINSNRVSATIHRGRLYLFWLVIKKLSNTITTNINHIETNYTFVKELYYSFLNERGKWIPPQRLSFITNTASSDTESKLKTDFPYFPNNIVFPLIINNRIHVVGYDYVISGNSTILPEQITSYVIDFFTNQAIQGPVSGYELITASDSLSLAQFNEPNGLHLGLATDSISIMHESRLEYDLMRIHTFDPLETKLVARYLDYSNAELRIVGIGSRIPYSSNDNPGNLILKIDNQQYFIYIYGFPAPSMPYGPIRPIPIPIPIPKKMSYRLSTSLADDLGEVLFNQGLERFLSLRTQILSEHMVGIDFINQSELLGPYDEPNHIDFEGAYGEYAIESYFFISLFLSQII